MEDVVVKVAACALVIVLAGCGKNVRDVAGESSLADGGGVFAGPGAGAEAGTFPPSECAEDTKDIFVITEENALYQFHPPTRVFKNIGLLMCPTGGATPTSMAVDRTGIAWIRHSDGSLWKVSMRDLTCTPTTFESPPAAFLKFGMGFSSASKGGSTEDLFLSDSAGAGLAKLDTSSLQITLVGPYTGALAGKTAELTGTGDGKLYGFFTTSPAQVAEIVKGTGAIASTKELAGVSAGDAWAFSFYGGDFYIYTHAAGEAGGSDVTRYRPSDGSIEVVLPKVGFTIVGAGVSTCAPTTALR